MQGPRGGSTTDLLEAQRGNPRSESVSQGEGSGQLRETRAEMGDLQLL